MPTVGDLAQFLESLAPLSAAEDWDNVGLLIGDQSRVVNHVMTCLTATAESVQEAIDSEVDLIVAHHPLPFQPIRRISVGEPTGNLLWSLAGAGISLFSLHTAFDSAVLGINAQLASGFNLSDVRPIVMQLNGPGAGRFGEFTQPLELGEVIAQVKSLLQIGQLQYVGELNQRIRRLAIACGSGGDFLEMAARAGCDCLLTGEARFHSCLEAKAYGMSLILAGHYATERQGSEYLAQQIAAHFPQITTWASQAEHDPVRFA